ncbi:MAG: hypothetical protein ACP6IP_05225 [Candidatus Njordarchaeia archaeon]
MLFVIFDPEFREEVISNYLNEKKEIEKIYKTLNRWINDVYNRGSLKIPAIFSSKVFFGDDTWNPAMQTRAIAAMFQLLINSFELPLWVFWGDVELENETVRLVYVFSNASKVEGIKGRVIISQFSDDDREVVLECKGKEVAIKTLLGGCAVLYSVYKRYNNEPVDMRLEKADKEFDKILEEAISMTLEEKVKEKTEKIEKFKLEEDTFEIPQLDEELKGLGLDEEG